MAYGNTQLFLGDTLVDFIYLGENQSGANPFLAKFVPTNGLFAYFDASSTQSYPGSGSTWFDISGNGLQLKTASGSAFPTYNSSTKDFTFNGTTMALAAAYSTGSNSIKSQSQITWIKIATATPAGTGIGNIQNQDGGGVGGLFDGFAYDEGDNQKFKLTSNDGSRTLLQSGSSISTTTYYMLAATRESGSFKLFINGELSATASFNTASYTNGNIIVGQRFLNNALQDWSSDGWFNGNISSYIVYNRALSDNEVSEIYIGGR
jgi:hypothetical protein